MKHRLSLSALLLLTIAITGHAQTCTSLSSDPQMAAFLRGLDSTAAAGPVWADYSVANHPIVLISQTPDSTIQSCATIWRYRRPPIDVALSGRVTFSTPLYGMWNVDSIAAGSGNGFSAITATLRRLPPEAERALREIGETRAVFLPVPLNLETLGALGRSLQEMKLDVRTMLLQLAVHESYHLHSQIPVWLGQRSRYTWPTWDVQPDRRAVVQQCYAGTPDVAAAHRRELQLLLAAWDTLSADTSTNSKGRGIALARQFIDARRQRYGMLTGVTIASPAGPVSCARAEDIMELEEGAPQWMSYATLSRAGLMDARKSGRSASEAFYVSGTFQLWILQRILGSERLRKLSDEITRAPNPEAGLFSRFVSVVSAPVRLPN